MSVKVSSQSAVPVFRRSAQAQAGIIPGLVALVIIEYLGIGLDQRVFSDHFGIETGRIAGGTAGADDQQRNHEEEGKCVFHRIVFHLLQTYCFFCVFP